jgi:hypothetical protein
LLLPLLPPERGAALLPLLLEAPPPPHPPSFPFPFPLAFRRLFFGCLLSTASAPRFRHSGLR